MSVATAAGFVTPATAGTILGKAHRQMLAVASAAGDGLDDDLKALLDGQAAAAAAPAPAGPSGGDDDKKEDKGGDDDEEEEEVSEEEAAGGLGALFG